MDLNRYVEQLGILHAGFNNLEGHIRTYLYLHELNEEPPPFGLNHYLIDNVVEISPLTEKLTFGKLLRRYNAVANPKMSYSDQLVEIRNGLAHGLLISDQSRAGTYRILNFKPNPKNERTMIVSFTMDVSDVWINHTRYLTTNAIDHVTNAFRQLRANRLTASQIASQ